MSRRTILDPSRYPVISKELREHCIAHDGCPQCGGELDTGCECNSCGFDAMHEKVNTPETDFDVDCEGK